MQLTYYGHSCFAVAFGGKVLLFDPFVSGNPLAANLVDKNSINCDYILVSHGHFDHILDAVEIAEKNEAVVIATWEVKDWLVGKGVQHTHPINPGGQWKFDFGMVKCVHAVHSSSLPDGTYGGSACGFVLKSDEGNFYYSGDTALTMDMTLINGWAKLDFVVLPIGDDLTMGVEDAIRACKMLNVTKVVGVHYDTFPFIVIDHEKSIELFLNDGIELLLPKIGDTIIV